jgi:hypothetical protein
MTFSIRRTLLIGATFLAALGASRAPAAVIDNTTQGNWIQGGNFVYGNDGYILMSFNAVVTGEYTASGNANGALSDLVNLPSYVTSYSYKSTGARGWYGNNGPGDVNNVNPLAGLQSPSDPNNPAAAKQVGAYVYVDGPGTATIEIQLGPNVPDSFDLTLYGSTIGRPGQAVEYGVLGDVATLQEPEYTDGVWALFTVAGALPNSVVSIDVNPLGSYAFISAVAFDSLLVPEPSSLLMGAMAGVGLLVASRGRRKAHRTATER